MLKAVLSLITTLALSTALGQTKALYSDSFELTPDYWSQTAMDVGHITPVEPLYDGPTRFPLTVVLNSQSNWTLEKVTEMIRITERAYQQSCGVSIWPITILHSNHPALSHVNCYADETVTANIPKDFPRPIVTFTDAIACTAPAGTFLTMNGGDNGYANPAYWVNALHREISLYTVFIPEKIQNYKSQAPKFTDGVVAHELLHIFADRGHNFDDRPQNLMNDNIYTRGLKIEDDQCERVINHQLTVRGG